MDDVYQLLLDMKQDMVCVKNDVSEIKTKLDNINTRMEDVETRTGALEENYISEQARLTDYMQHMQEVTSDFQQRMRQVEDQVNAHDDMLHPEFDPEKTIVAVRLPDDGSSVMSQATSLLVRGLGDHTTIVRTTRLNGHDDQPGIVKIELPTKDDKISILRKKSNLAVKSPYENTYLRSSQPHVARLQAANLRVIMDKVPALSDCRLTGNGRIVSSHDNRPPRYFYNTSRSRRDIPSDRHNRDHLSGFREQRSVPHDQPSSSSDQPSSPHDRRSPRDRRETDMEEEASTLGSQTQDAPPFIQH